MLTSTLKKAIKLNKIFPEFDAHEKIIRFQERTSGGLLRGFITIHSTAIGPAMGGTRYAEYNSEEDALRDALNLSRSMSYKCALANVPYGGGKTVIIKERKTRKTEEFLEKYAEQVNALAGSFYTGEDVGLVEKDINTLAKSSPYIVGLPSKGGLPGPWAALGVFYAMKATAKFTYGNDSLKDKVIAIKGVGEVGAELCRLLIGDGADVIISDIKKQRLGKVKKENPAAKVVPTELLHKQDIDIYAPCALGYDLTRERVLTLKAKVICGAANNQFAKPPIDKLIFRKGICYVPDYIANAGGLISVSDELHKDGHNKERVEQKIKDIYETTLEILKLAAKNKRPTGETADEIARKRISKYDR